MESEKNMIDICLILEGTYPFAIGGVSTWVHSLITGLPELSFGVVHLASQPDVPGMKFARPENLVKVKVIPLRIEKKSIRFDELLDGLPEARVYHALSTGFAGLIGTEQKKQSGRPLLLTEHGIYWHEIAMGVDELECGFKIIETETGPLNLGLSWQGWLNSFRDFARKAYAAADIITTVCHANREKQLSLGAEADKCRVVFNGVDVDLYHGVRSRGHTSVQRIGLVGRVTPLKDIKTFIRACALIRQSMPDTQFYVIGPTEQNEKYFHECFELVDTLNLDRFIFTGNVNPLDYYKQLDVVVLTSRSEGQPLALLEAMAAGIPVVATDVGGCREIVQPEYDDSCPAGIICPPEDHRAIANAIVQICQNTELYRNFSRCGVERVKAHYTRQNFLDAYRNLYGSFLH